MEASSFLIVRRLLPVLLSTALCASAGEYAILATGFRIHALSHVIEGDSVSLSTETGVIVLPSSSIRGFELEEYSAPPPPTPVPPAVAAADPVPAQPVDP